MQETGVQAFAVVDGILEDLLEQGRVCAPHVVSRLISQVTDDPETVTAVAARLDEPQRLGLRPLPSPLPMVDPIADLFADLDPSARDRELLLATALLLDDRLDPLLAFDGRSAEAVLDSAVAHLLVIRAGRVRLADPRLSVWIVATSSAATISAVHLRLHDVFLARGEQADAEWHRARASVHGVPEAAGELTRLAREHSETGSTDRAVRLASEAAAHSTGAPRDEAILVAGSSAIAAGYAVEAVDLLSGLFPDGDEGCRLRGLGHLFVAQAHLQGAVPEVDLAALAPRGRDRQKWFDWARAAGYAAILSAERGERAAMRRWLRAVHDGCARAGRGRELQDPVIALAWLLAGDRDLDQVPGEGPLTGGMLRALRAAIDGDVDRGLRLLAAGDAGIRVEEDPFVAGCERSPLVAAYRAVVEVLLLTWRGDIGVARSRLLHAALDLPVALPFAGLAVVLARRLDLAVLGRLSPFARALTAVLPAALRIDQLVDRGIHAFLAGSFDEAASCVRLWRDRGAPQPSLSVPGLEEVDTAAMLPAPPRRPEPPEMALTRELCATISRCPDREWPAEYPRIVASARSIASPFFRGRLEAMIGTRWLIRGDDVTGDAHLASAQSLLEVCGADAWAEAVSARRDRPDEGGHRTPGAGGVTPTAARRMWEPALTARELEVAMLAVGGASNRDIASSLHLSVRTVEVHLGRVFAKLDVRTRVELTVLAHRIDRFG